MEKHKKSAEILENGCRLISLVSYYSTEAKQQLLVGGGADAVRLALLEGEGSYEVESAAKWALVALSLSPEELPEGERERESRHSLIDGFCCVARLSF
jgi:hypothetical protein